VLASLLVLACSADPLSSPDLGGDASRTDALADVDGAGCIGLGACDCWRRSECDVVSELCWCPFPECGTNGACGGCGGGKFLGCAPRSSGCPSGITCGPAAVGYAGPDGKGCYRCDYSDDCMTAFMRLKERCMLGDAIVGGFSCSKNAACVTQCVNDVKQCSDVGCGLCQVCGCGAFGSFEKCFWACTSG